jgi:hypothetical protein
VVERIGDLARAPVFREALKVVCCQGGGLDELSTRVDRAADLGDVLDNWTVEVASSALPEGADSDRAAPCRRNAVRFGREPSVLY